MSPARLPRVAAPAMEPDHSPLDYRSPGDAAQDEAPPPSGRSLQTWLILCAVWAVGLCVWMLYLALVVVVLVKIVG